MIGGDFNVTFNTNLDCSGGKPIVKKSVKALEELKLNHDLVDIWRVRNPKQRNLLGDKKHLLPKEDLTFG